MVKRFRLCSRDRYTLDRLKEKEIISYPQPGDYRNKVVIKPWGFEYLVFDNKLIAIWFLHVRSGHGTSMHCHPIKKTTMIVLSGETLCSGFSNRSKVVGLDAIIIDKGVFHSTKALSLEGANMIEIETPPDKTDLVRFGDSYDRELSGYEGLSEMRTENLEEFGHFFVESPGKGENAIHRNAGYEITFETCVRGENLTVSNSQARNALYVLCQGRIVDSKDKSALSIGEAVWIDTLRELGTLTVSEYTVLLKTRLVGSYSKS